MSQYENITYGRHTTSGPRIHYTPVVTEENNEAVDPDLHRQTTPKYKVQDGWRLTSIVSPMPCLLMSDPTLLIYIAVNA